MDQDQNRTVPAHVVRVAAYPRAGGGLGEGLLQVGREDCFRLFHFVVLFLWEL